MIEFDNMFLLDSPFVIDCQWPVEEIEAVGWEYIVNDAQVVIAYEQRFSWYLKTSLFLFASTQEDNIGANFSHGELNFQTKPGTNIEGVNLSGYLHVPNELNKDIALRRLVRYVNGLSGYDFRLLSAWDEYIDNSVHGVGVIWVSLFMPFDFLS